MVASRHCFWRTTYLKFTIGDKVSRTQPTGYRLAQVKSSPEELAPYDLPLTLSPQPPPCLTLERAQERLALLGLPFLFLVDVDQGRAAVLYHRYDGHYGLIYPAG